MRRHFGPARRPQSADSGLPIETQSRLHRWAMMLDGFVERIYRTGCVQSVILNTAVLLALALLVAHPTPAPDRITLSLRFEAAAEPVLDLDDPPTLAFFEEPLPAEVPEQASLPSPVVVDDAATAPIEVAEADFESFTTRPINEPDAADLLMEVPSAPAPRAGGPVRAVAFHSSPNDTDGRGPDAGGGIGGELGRRLRVAGAKTGDVQVSIRWDDCNDIDVHVIVEPFGDGPWWIINWMNRIGMCGGMLDVDANATVPAITWQPVENVFWAKGRAPYGRYTVMVHHFRSWSGKRQTPVEVAVLVDGEVQRFYPVAISGDEPQTVVSFERHPQKKAVLQSAATSLSPQVAP